jgi:hypothetical protein
MYLNKLECEGVESSKVEFCNRDIH